AVHPHRDRPAFPTRRSSDLGANALEVEKAVMKKMAELARAFPQDIHYDTPFDTTKFVSASIEEVYKTLIEAGLLVLVVIMVFLRSEEHTSELQSRSDLVCRL